MPVNDPPTEPTRAVLYAFAAAAARHMPATCAITSECIA